MSSLIKSVTVDIIGKDTTYTVGVLGVTRIECVGTSISIFDKDGLIYQWDDATFILDESDDITYDNIKKWSKKHNDQITR